MGTGQGLAALGPKGSLGGHGTVAAHTAPHGLQDLFWMLTFYARLCLTYVPLLGLWGFLGLFFIVR